MIKLIILTLIILFEQGFAKNKKKKNNFSMQKKGEILVKLENRDYIYAPFSLKDQKEIDFKDKVNKSTSEAYIVWSFGTSKKAIHKKVLNSNSLYFFDLDKKKGFNIYTKKVYTTFQNDAHFVAIGKLDLKDFQAKKYKVTLPYIDLKFLNYAGGVIFFFSPSQQKKNKIFLSLYSKSLYPGDIHTVLTFSKKHFSRLKKVILFGGGALPKAASNNLINGISLTGKEDWNGSEGTRWDVDSFEITDNNQYYLTKKNRYLKLQIDPLMQWIFLSSYLVEYHNQ